MQETTALPDDGRAEVRVMSADKEAAELVWERAASALGYAAAPRRRSTRSGGGVRLYGVMDAPERALPGQRDGAESSTAHLMAGERITVDEIAVQCSAVAVWLDQLARAAETPETPVELEHDIDSLRQEARTLRERAERLSTVARILEGDLPLAAKFVRGDAWGAAALDTDREDFGGPAIIPTANQLLHLAGAAAYASETLTYPEGMAGVPSSLLLSWESKTAQERRRRERASAIAEEVLRIECEPCGAGRGDQCRTKTGRVAEQVHRSRRREAEANVDARIGWVGDNPVTVEAG